MELVEAPTAEPVTIAEARVHLRQASDDPSDVMNFDANWGDDSWVAAKITAAREAVEHFLGVPITDALYVEVLDSFPASIAFPRFVSTVVRVDYLDVAHQVQTLSSAAYYFDAFSRQLFFTAEAPAISDRASPVRVYVRGSGQASQSERHAMLLLLAHWYRNRGDEPDKAPPELPYAVQYLLRPTRVALGMA